MTTVVDINPAGGYIVFGAFDTRYRYLRNGTDSERFPVPKEDTFVMESGTHTPPNPFPNWRYSNGVTANSFTQASDTPISYDPAYTLVNL